MDHLGNTLASSLAKTIKGDYIDSGQYAEGDQLPSVREMERRYGVSKTTIAHALGILEARGAVEKRHGKGSFVKTRDISAPAPGVRAVGLVVPYASGHLADSKNQPGSDPDVVMRVYDGVSRAVERHDYHALVSSSSWSYDEERRQVERLVRAGCCGAIVMPMPRFRSQLHTDYLRTEFADFPIVLIDMATPQQGRCLVLFDNYRAGYEVTERLIAEGHRRIAYMSVVSQCGELVHVSLDERYRGYLAALRAGGLMPRPEDHWMLPWNDPSHIPELTGMVGSLRDMPSPPTAIIACDDLSAAMTANMIEDLGFRVPDDVRVVGFDNMATAQSLRRDLPTTNPDFALAGDTAVELLFRLIRGELTHPVTYMLPVPILWKGNPAPVHEEARVPVP